MEEKGGKIKFIVKKYVVNKSAKTLSVFTTIICVLFYVVLLIVDYIVNMGVAFYILKELLLVVISIFGTNLLINLLVETKSQNSMFTDFLSNDIVSSPDFYNNISDEIKTKMINAIELSTKYKGSKSMQQMYHHMQDKLLNVDKGYYIKESRCEIQIEEKDGFFEKVITRKNVLCTFGEELNLPDYMLVSIVYAKKEGIVPLDWEYIKINDVNLDLKNDIRLDESFERDCMTQQQAYDSRIAYYCKDPIVLKKDMQVTIEIRYTNRFPINDVVSTYRVAAPCKKFEVHATIRPENKYKLFANGFGFVSGARKGINSTYDNEATVTFDDWIFNENGVCITIYEK